MAELSMYEWFVTNCPKCNHQNWFGSQEWVEPYICWKCNHRWISFIGDDTLFQIFCEDNGIKEGLSEDYIGDEPIYETVLEYLDKLSGEHDVGFRFEQCSTVEQRKKLYEELKKEFGHGSEPPTPS